MQQKHSLPSISQENKKYILENIGYLLVYMISTIKTACGKFNKDTPTKESVIAFFRLFCDFEAHLVQEPIGALINAKDYRKRAAKITLVKNKLIELNIIKEFTSSQYSISMKNGEKKRTIPTRVAIRIDAESICNLLKNKLNAPVWKENNSSKAIKLQKIFDPNSHVVAPILPIPVDSGTGQPVQNQSTVPSQTWESCYRTGPTAKSVEKKVEPNIVEQLRSTFFSFSENKNKPNYNVRGNIKHHIKIAPIRKETDPVVINNTEKTPDEINESAPIVNNAREISSDEINWLKGRFNYFLTPQNRGPSGEAPTTQQPGPKVGEKRKFMK